MLWKMMKLDCIELEYLKADDLEVAGGKLIS